MPNFPLIIRFAFFLAVCGLIGGVLAPRRIRRDRDGESSNLGDIGCCLLWRDTYVGPHLLPDATVRQYLGRH